MAWTTNHSTGVATDSSTGATMQVSQPAGSSRISSGGSSSSGNVSSGAPSGGTSNPLYIGKTNWDTLKGEYTDNQLAASTQLIDGNRYWNPDVSISNVPATPSQATLPTTAGAATNNFNLRTPDYQNAYTAPDISSIYAGIQGDKEYITAREQSDAARFQAGQDLLNQKKETEKPFLDKLFGAKKTSEVFQESLENMGFDQSEYFANRKAKLAEMETLNIDYVNTQTQQQAKIDAAETSMASTRFIDAKTGQINRDYTRILNAKASVINARAAVMQAQAGDFAQANQLASQAANLHAADLKQDYDNFALFKDENKEYFDLLSDQYTTAYDFQEEMANTAYQTKLSDAQYAGQQMITYNAGIEIGDSRATVNQKIASANGLKYTQPGSGSSEWYPTDDEVAKLNEAGLGNAPASSQQKFLYGSIVDGDNGGGLGSDVELAANILLGYENSTSGLTDAQWKAEITDFSNGTGQDFATSEALIRDKMNEMKFGGQNANQPVAEENFGSDFDLTGLVNDNMNFSQKAGLGAFGEGNQGRTILQNAKTFRGFNR